MPNNMYEFLMQRCEEQFYYLGTLSDRDKLIIKNICELISEWCGQHNATIFIPASKLIVENDEHLFATKTIDYAVFLVTHSSHEYVARQIRLPDSYHTEDGKLLNHVKKSAIVQIFDVLMSKLYPEEFPPR